MTWYNPAVFYHIYPLGLCGCPHENQGEPASHFDKLTRWADHAAGLNCSALYIGPLFESGSHGYDTVDYRRVDRRLGENEDFRRFVTHCHKQGMKVVVDGVFHHTGRGFFAFEDLKKHRENSRYKDWYCNVNFWNNNEYNDGFSYDNWGGHNMLAKLNIWNPEVRNYLFDTVRFWVSEFDIDGIRLDAADVLDFGFMKDLRGLCDSLKPEFWLLGEVIHGDYSRWANEGMLHSVTNYEMHKGLYSGHNDHNYFEIAHSIRRLMQMTGGRIPLYTFMDNHDVSRLVNKLHNRDHVLPIAMIAYMMPGIPSLYYGSEFGIEGEKQWGSDWNLRPDLNLEDYDENGPLPCLFRALGQIKKEYPEASYGEYKELLLANRQFAFARVLNGKCIVTAVNNDESPARLAVGLPVEAHSVRLLPDQVSLSDTREAAGGRDQKAANPGEAAAGQGDPRVANSREATEAQGDPGPANSGGAAPQTSPQTSPHAKKTAAKKGDDADLGPALENGKLIVNLKPGSGMIVYVE